MELKDNISTKPADARIVQAVRKLKSSKLVEQKMEVRKNQEDITQLNDTSNMHIIINSNNSNNNISQKKTVTPLQINQKQKTFSILFPNFALVSKTSISFFSPNSFTSW